MTAEAESPTQSSDTTQLNKDQPYSYSRDQLVEMLEAALAE
ncbi:MAG: hypothetical protein QNJ40_18890 [Xanthomonadales bacterium]|nr:hypothetical protein [Xanthomonadales bacterium]